MDPVAASESFLQQVGQNLVRTLFGGKQTEEKKQEATEEEGEPNLSAQVVDTTAEDGETPVDPSNESAVCVQENRDDKSISTPGPDISERPHLGQTEQSIPQKSKIKSSDSCQPTVADEEVTESRHGQDDQSPQIAVSSAEPLKSPDNHVMQIDTCAAKSESLTPPNRSERSAEGRTPVVESKALSWQDKVDWKENVQREQLHTDSQGLPNAPEDTTMQYSPAPTSTEDKFLEKTQIPPQMPPKESLQDMSGETLSKDKSAHTSHQESEESVCTTQSLGADPSESSLAADAGTVSIPLLTSCSEPPAGVKEALCIQENQEKQPMSDHADNEKFVTQTGQLEETDSDAANLRETDKATSESEATNVVKEITTCHEIMSNKVQPRPALAANSDRPFPLDQEHQQSPNRDSLFSDSGVSTPDVQVDVKDAVALCTSTEKADATETKATDIRMPADTPGAKQESDVDDLKQRSSCLLEGTKTTDTADPVNKPKSVQETGASENLEKSSSSQAMTEATDATMPVDTSQVVQETPSNEPQEKPCSHPETIETDTAMVQYTSQADQDSGPGDLTVKPSCSGAGTKASDSAMTVDSPQVLHESLSNSTVDRPPCFQAGTEESDTDIPAGTLQPEQESGTGDISSESPRSQAGAEANDSVKPVDVLQALPDSGSNDIQERPPSSQARVKDIDTDVHADTPQPKPEIRPAGTKATDAAMAVDTDTESKVAGLDMRRQASSQRFEALPSLSQKHHILRQLYGKLMGNRVLVLLGEAGSGKTTAAVLLAHYAPVWCGAEFVSYLYDADDDRLPEKVITFPSKSLIIIDDFLGKHDVDSILNWDAVVPLLESMRENVDNQILLLLTSRTAVFQKLLSSKETDVRMHLNENHVTSITIDYRKMWKDICADVKLKTPDFENLPSIGFPLCCQLAPHLDPDVQTILFQQPRLALRRTVRTLMDSTGIARTALTLLAVTKGSLDINIFTSLPRLQESMCYEIRDFLPQASNDEETPAQIIAFYRNCAFLIQVCNDAVSFRSEVIQEAVLVELCDSSAKLLAKYCSLELLSQIALATSDKDTSDDAEKPALSDSAKSVFLSRLLEEMNDAGNYDAMFSPILQHHSILNMFECTVKEQSLLKQWTQKCSQSGLHFVFYAGAVPSVFRSALSELDKTNLWVVLQAVLACCYWGYNSDISDLMKVWKNKTDLKKALKEATIRDIVTGSLPGLSRREEPRWELIPVFPEDTLLILSVRRGNDAVVKTLAYRDMNVNSQGMKGRTALMHYCAHGKTDMVEFLLGREADPMIRDELNMTALMYALQRKQWDIPQKLLTTESCRAENSYLQSPLMFACSHKWSTQMLKTLIDKGADFLQKDKWSYTCLHYACLQGHTDIVEYLLKEKKVDMRGKTAFGHTPLTLAVTGPGRSELAKLLLNTEATKDAEDTEVINMVCRASDRSVMKTLLSVCRKEEDVKNFALLPSSRYGNTEMVGYLLRSGADAGTTNPADAYTALHYACVGSSVDCCKILLNKIDPNVRENIGSTPLMMALKVGALDCARLLLRQGAKLNATSKIGGCLHHATKSNVCSALDWCIKEHKMNVNMKNCEGMTPLQLACARGKYYSVKYLLDNGADIMNVDDAGDICLHDAARGGHWDIVRLLDKVDPSLMNVPNKKGETPAQLLKTTPTTQSASAE